MGAARCARCGRMAPWWSSTPPTTSGSVWPDSGWRWRSRPPSGSWWSITGTPSLKRLPLRGLRGEILVFDRYLQLMEREARAQARRRRLAA